MWQRYQSVKWRGGRDSNPRRLLWQRSTLTNWATTACGLYVWCWIQDSNSGHFHYKWNTLAIWANPAFIWWRILGSNQRHLTCKASALPSELIPHLMVVPRRLELRTFRLSSERSNQLSYGTLFYFWNIFQIIWIVTITKTTISNMICLAKYKIKQIADQNNIFIFFPSKVVAEAGFGPATSRVWA